VSAFFSERVTRVHHWNDTLFSFQTTRDPTLRFRNGHFVMIGLPVDGKPLLRAYSIASANHEEHLEFLSIKVPDGPLTSRLQHLKVDDTLLVGRKPVGTLVIDDLNPGRRLILLASGTGLAPFMSIVQDPETYERFEEVVLLHGVRLVSELAYRDFLTQTLPNDELLGELVKPALRYVPTVTREPFERQGRVTELLNDDRADDVFGGRPIDPREDRVMICGGPAMLADLRAILDQRGFVASPQTGVPGDYVFERAFVER
jgi:ferredoxin--NADP+ reductase